MSRSIKSRKRKYASALGGRSGPRDGLGVASCAVGQARPLQSWRRSPTFPSSDLRSDAQRLRRGLILKDPAFDKDLSRMWRRHSALGRGSGKIQAYRSDKPEGLHVVGTVRVLLRSGVIIPSKYAVRTRGHVSFLSQPLCALILGTRLRRYPSPDLMDPSPVPSVEQCPTSVQQAPEHRVPHRSRGSYNLESHAGACVDSCAVRGYAARTMERTVRHIAEENIVRKSAVGIDPPSCSDSWHLALHDGGTDFTKPSLVRDQARIAVVRSEIDRVVWDKNAIHAMVCC